MNENHCYYCAFLNRARLRPLMSFKEACYVWKASCSQIMAWCWFVWAALVSTRDELITQTYSKWYVSLVRFLKRRLGNEAQAEDMAQESFLRWSASPADRSPDNPKAYVTRIALNAAYESARKYEQEVPQGLPLEAEGQESWGPAAIEKTCPQRSAENRQMLERLEQAVQELPELQREAFVRHRFDGLTYEEIAAELKVSRAWVSKHISQSVAYCRLRVNYPSLQAMQEALAAQEARRET